MDTLNKCFHVVDEMLKIFVLSVHSFIGTHAGGTPMAKIIMIIAALVVISFMALALLLCTGRKKTENTKERKGSYSPTTAEDKALNADVEVTGAGMTVDSQRYPAIDGENDTVSRVSRLQMNTSTNPYSRVRDISRILNEKEDECKRSQPTTYKTIATADIGKDQRKSNKAHTNYSEPHNSSERVRFGPHRAISEYHHSVERDNVYDTTSTLPIWVKHPNYDHVTLRERQFNIMDDHYTNHNSLRMLSVDSDTSSTYDNVEPSDTYDHTVTSSSHGHVVPSRLQTSQI